MVPENMGTFSRIHSRSAVNLSGMRLLFSPATPFISFDKSHYCSIVNSHIIHRDLSNLIQLAPCCIVIYWQVHLAVDTLYEQYHSILQSPSLQCMGKYIRFINRNFFIVLYPDKCRQLVHIQNKNLFKNVTG
jgi:hypothetical protein